MVTVGVGREAPLQGLPREGPECALKLLFRCKHEITFTARSGRFFGRGPGEAIEKYGTPRRRSPTLHSSGSPALRRPS
jgi:hypothetical protein